MTSKQRVWHTFPKSSYCFTGKQHTDVTKQGRKTKQLWYKSLGAEHHQEIFAEVLGENCQVHFYLRRNSREFRRQSNSIRNALAR